MAEPKHIDDIITMAQREGYFRMQRIEAMRQKVTPEKFKELFLVRAQQVMIDHKSVSEFVVDEQNREIINLMYSYATRANMDKINNLAGIVLNGKYGCGKSVIMSTFCKVLNDLNFHDKDKVMEVHAIELAESIKINGVIPYAHRPLLIQDMGKEPAVVNDFGTQINPIGNLLAVRAEYGSLTFGTTNMDLEALEKHYEKYIRRRITEHVNLIHLPGASRRPDYSINQPK